MDGRLRYGGGGRGTGARRPAVARATHPTRPFLSKPARARVMCATLSALAALAQGAHGRGPRGAQGPARLLAADRARPRARRLVHGHRALPRLRLRAPRRPVRAGGRGRVYAQVVRADGRRRPLREKGHATRHSDRAAESDSAEWVGRQDDSICAFGEGELGPILYVTPGRRGKTTFGAAL
eukprot:3906514-Prymnesium_polylepis.1